MKTHVAFMLSAVLFVAAPGAANAQTNVALGQYAQACSTYQGNAAWGPDKAFDGSVSTKWVSNGQVPCWIFVSLGGYRQVRQVTVKHATTGDDTWVGMNTDVYQVMYWTASGWVTAASVDNSLAHEPVTTSYVNFYTDYVMIYITDPGMDNFVRITEIEVYQEGDTNPDPGTGRIGWPFSGDKDNRGSWVQSTGSSLHVGDDQYAEDWVNGSPARCGDNVYAPIAGTVIYAGYTGDGSGFASYGYQVVIRSSIDRDYAFRVAHLQAGSIIHSVGAVVSVGDYIGRVGNTPNWSICHAHFALYKDIKLTSSNGYTGVQNLRAGSSPSGAITNSPSPFAQEFNPNAPGRRPNP